MQISTSAIVISKIRYGDNDLIVKCYTKQLGVVSYILKGVLKSKKANVKTAYFQLLSLLQLDTSHKENSSLQFIKDVRLNHLYKTLHTNVIKGSVVMFLAEILSNTLKEEEKNPMLYEYLETAFIWFDKQDQYANFHLLFLLRLTRHLGFYPDTSNIQFDYFNLSEGEFQSVATSKHTISGENLILLKCLLGIKFEALNSIKLNSKQRLSFLKMILLYFELHLSGFKQPRSLQLFNQVFN
jgi:DNA repair protein RecO (recombination protein O)